MSPSRSSQVSLFLHQLPFLVWLVALWMLLWGQFTWLAFLTGLVMAVFVTRVFRLPPVELSGRINLWYGLIFVVTFLGAVVKGSLIVAWQVLDFRRQPGAAIIAVPLRVDDDVIMAHTAITASLIPGSLIVDVDRENRTLFLHTIGVRNDRDAEHQRRIVLGWEARITRAVGSKEELQELRAKIAESGAAAHHGAETPRDGRTLL
ncbi:Na+/H+ antiporter subunit E [Microbacterium sp. che218]|uniref:Na+/H+ antiporter subunit E n=1 Tax=Microbacterium sp. che218 TaxID=3140649 RepID=UPI00336C18A4